MKTKDKLFGIYTEKGNKSVNNLAFKDRATAVDWINKICNIKWLNGLRFIFIPTKEIRIIREIKENDKPYGSKKELK